MPSCPTGTHPSPHLTHPPALAFIDADEFLVIADGSPSLPALLKDYEGRGGLAVNWRIFGSSGHEQHQPSTLRAYTACYPKQVWVSKPCI